MKSLYKIGRWVVITLALAAFVGSCSMASAGAATQRSQLPSFGYDPYGSLATGFRSGHARVAHGNYYRTAVNKYDHDVDAWFENLATGATSKAYHFRAGESKRMQIRLSSHRRAHYTLVVQTDPEITQSGGVWTPRYGSWWLPTKTNPTFTTCSQNPLKVRAVLNGRSARLHGTWRLKAYTHHYVKPGGYACISWKQPRHSHRKVIVSWNNGYKHKEWTDGYEIVARR